jgi:glycosyl transferase family 25
MQYHTYIINLNSANKRWKNICRNLDSLQIPYTRIEAIDGNKEPAAPAAYNRTRYNITHGKTTNPGEIGCYLSHIKALHAFLESTLEYALILEDDVTLPAHIKELIESAIQHSCNWDLLRLSAHTPGKPLPFAELPHGHVLAYNTHVLKNTGAYLVNRRAAQLICEKMVPMHLPYDVALDCEWRYGFKSAFISPLPVLVDYNLPSQIAPTRKIRLFRTTTFKLFHGIRNLERRIHRKRYLREAQQNISAGERRR